MKFFLLCVALHFSALPQNTQVIPLRPYIYCSSLHLVIAGKSPAVQAHTLQEWSQTLEVWDVGVSECNAFAELTRAVSLYCVI